ncbi:N-acetylmuramoyl-L-alanine amidase [Aquicella lusitana]|uniref:N-acetylmuramoyl-L-alanine amidase AmiC n=2 Tax=Aquicella lusitana TaxID=254246 RepID=A0A370GEI1_9COXI|nr:N-acetylmuramoyl-L-alanine amidase [Aquicella lusitana]RDI41509.1 N-acetylmuramoyl-L-alanine amidase [Aquicella lusitana]VVC72597.1 N-acetylmuramoyl-L-alanine amidase AmiA [Aquicella lusitana]
MRQWALLLLLVLFPIPAMAKEPVYLTGMRIQPSSDATRLVFVLTTKTAGRVRYMPHPDRLIVEFTNTTKRFIIRNAKLGDSNITSINAETANGTLRFIFHVKGKVKWTTQYLPNEKGSGVVLQLDVISVKPASRIKPLPLSRQESRRQNLPEQKFEPVPVTTASPLLFKHDDVMARFGNLIKQIETKKETSKQIAQVVVQPKKPESVVIKKARLFTLVIDPGHGGKDPGARGPNGIQEKDVVLAIAKQLAKELNSVPGMRTVLTRQGDYYVSLRDRLRIARKYDADLFVAIHADAYFDNSAAGASVYALSQRGATSEAARWLAKRENYSELGDVELNELKDRSLMLRKVLIDLSQTTTIQHSIRLGNKVLDALDEVSSLHYKKVEQAPFVVLKSPDIPSILVETGFITNPREARRLSSSDYQLKVARALRRGIDQYVKAYGAVRVSENSQSLSSPGFHFIVRHQLLALTPDDNTAYS